MELHEFINEDTGREYSSEPLETNEVCFIGEHTMCVYAIRKDMLIKIIIIYIQCTDTVIVNIAIRNALHKDVKHKLLNEILKKGVKIKAALRDTCTDESIIEKRLDEVEEIVHNSINLLFGNAAHG